MAVICPTVTADNAHTYRAQIERVAGFASRIHIDIADGSLAPSQLLPLEQVWWPDGLQADLHVMTRRPLEHLTLYRTLAPQLVVVHAEAEGDYTALANQLQSCGIKVGVALLPDTPVSAIEPALHLIDHVLVFSGNFGSFGGTADLRLLSKVQQLRQRKPSLEIGWDGGVSSQNANQLVAGGVDILNVGGYIQRSPDPSAAFTELGGLLA